MTEKVSILCTQVYGFNEIFAVNFVVENNKQNSVILCLTANRQPRLTNSEVFALSSYCLQTAIFPVWLMCRVEPRLGSLLSAQSTLHFMLHGWKITCAKFKVEKRKNITFIVFKATARCAYLPCSFCKLSSLRRS